MTDRKALKLALEALELLSQHPIEMALDYADNAIDVLRERLAHCDRCGKKLGGPDHIHTCSPQVQEPVMCRVCGDERGSWAWLCNACGAFDESPQPRKPPAQQEQEPVAWMFQHEETGRTMCVDAQQVEWGFEKGNPRLKKIAPLYTTPPQRKPLLASDIVTMYDENPRSDSEMIAFARAIEAAHGIKGEA